MLPSFDESGRLPPGVHLATLDEIDARFGRQSELRRVQMESVRWMVDLAVRAGAQRIILNGSFVTDIIEPNDVDCLLLFPLDTRTSGREFEELESGLPFLDVQIADAKEFDAFAGKFFATDKLGLPKGMVEIRL